MVANPFKITHIPNDVHLFRGILQDHFQNGKISSAAFKSDEVCVNREDMCTWQSTQSQKPTYIAVSSVLTRFIREIDALDALHKPEIDNEAHSIIDGHITRSLARRIAKECTVYP